VVICLERGAKRFAYSPADATATIFFCFSKIQNGSAFLVLSYPGCPQKEAVKWEYIADACDNVTNMVQWL